MMMERRRLAPEAVGIILAVAVAALAISLDLGAALNVYDGGISASGATSTLHGQLPYRDYWLLYGPMSGVLLAVPTAVLGPSVELTRVVGAGVLGLQVLIAYGVARTWATLWPAVILALAAVVMLPAVQSLDVSAWPLAMTFALAAIYISISTRQSGIVVGFLVGFAFLNRLDVGIYALLAVLVVRDRRATLLGFLAIGVPFALFLVATTPLPSLVEQLVWYPIVGPRLFRGLAGPDSAFGQPTAALLQIPLLLLPRSAIVLAAVRLGWSAAKRRWDSTTSRMLCLTGFAMACQLQTLGRADVEHFAQAATPAILLFAIWFSAPRLSVFRFAGLAGVGAACLVVGLAGHRLHGEETAYDRSLVAASSWVRDATNPSDRVFVGLTDNRFTVVNPLIVYYLADRAPAVRDAMYNPGVTNTDWGQLRMVEDLVRTDPPYVVLDRKSADLREDTADGRIPGSLRLDDYLKAHYRTVCDLGSVVIQARDDLLASPTCPVVAS